MKKWLETGILPADPRLKTDLTGPKKKPDSKGVMYLESKKDMRARKLASPDAADALAVTFAYKVADREYNEKVAAKRASRGAAHAGHNSTSWMGQ